ncbi:MAG: hypothetical protein MJ065_08715 [Oscillospiraceae bacterium]|nr:hypothetical protein [Oscillospiraceae bacterium]
MAIQNTDPFSDEAVKLVHFEKDESHYEYCRMQMHDIERTHRRTFFCNLVICIIVCFLSVFRKYIGGFDILSTPLGLNDVRAAGAVLAGGIFVILIAMLIIVLGYLAWANYHTLNLILEAWYVIVTVIGISRLDYLTAIIGIIGAVFYFFSIRAMSHEQSLSEMEGYPDFQEKFDISKSDIMIQTLLAHQGEHRTKSTLFTTDYSLRKKKKKQGYFKHGSSVNGDAEAEKNDAGAELAQILQKQLSEAKDAKQTRTAIASLDAEAAARQREKDGVTLKDIAEFEKLPASAAAETAAKPSGLTEAAEDAAAKILADAEARARAILAEAEEKAKAMAAEPKSAAETKPAADTASAKPSKEEKMTAENRQPAQRGKGNPQNRRRKKK